ncbi:MAG TPA: F0F1 ATP synthase subunit A [Bacteroidales bacterium]|nr:F0F1 ATP synthase subunit A [Bacteroidales bacterium]HSA44504.1 F0F1 ATP synthase subunit A [Bacteroidales bacterium]
MNNLKHRGLYSFFFILTGILTLVSARDVSASPGDTHHEGQQQEFNAGRMIVDHIIDSHEWHILSIGHTHLSIPLPVILWHEGKLDVFMSSKFHHGHEAYKGYMISPEGEHKGKIVRTKEGLAEEDAAASLPLDFSVTRNVLSLFISVVLLLVIFISIARRYQKNRDEAPRGLQSLLEPLILFIRDEIALPSIGPAKYERYMPYLLTLFFFIFFNNLMGLIPFFPGGANLTGNIAVTMVLALFTFVITTFSGNRAYWMHIVNAPGVPWWLKIPVPLMPLVELIGVFTKPFVLMVRLFANITAGHIIMLGFISLIFIFGNISAGLGYGVSVISIAFAIFMTLLEMLVAFIQAFVFTLLSALYFGMATEDHGHAAHEAKH